MKAQHVRKMLQRLFSDTVVPNLGKYMFVLTKHQPENNDKPSKTSDNPSVMHPLKDTPKT